MTNQTTTPSLETIEAKSAAFLGLEPKGSKAFPFFDFGSALYRNSEILENVKPVHEEEFARLYPDKQVYLAAVREWKHLWSLLVSEIRAAKKNRKPSVSGSDYLSSLASVRCHKLRILAQAMLSWRLMAKKLSYLQRERIKALELQTV